MIGGQQPDVDLADKLVPLLKVGLERLLRRRRYVVSLADHATSPVESALAHGIAPRQVHHYPATTLNIAFGLISVILSVQPAFKRMSRRSVHIYTTDSRFGRMDVRALVGQNFVRLRKRLGLSQKQCAERSGFSQQYLSDLEHGRRNPTIVTVYELAQSLSVSPVELLRPPRPMRGSLGCAVQKP